MIQEMISWATTVAGCALVAFLWTRLPKRWRRRLRRWVWRQTCRACSWLWDEIRQGHRRSSARGTPARTRTSAPRPWPVELGGPTVVYRHYDAAGRLLYVGITGAHRQGQRWREHEETKPWWPLVAQSTVSDPYPTRADALYAEACAIRDEKPIHNIARPNPDLIGRH